MQDEILAANKRRHIPEQLLCAHGNVILADPLDLGRFERTDREEESRRLGLKFWRSPYVAVARVGVIVCGAEL